MGTGVGQVGPQPTTETRTTPPTRVPWYLRTKDWPRF